jgi:hypothetical protein
MRQQVLAGVVLGDDPGQQVALGRDDFTVFVGVFVEQRELVCSTRPRISWFRRPRFSRWLSRSWRYSM